MRAGYQLCVLGDEGARLVDSSLQLKSAPVFGNRRPAARTLEVAFDFSLCMILERETITRHQFAIKTRRFGSVF
jgi:hypothetical protein